MVALLLDAVKILFGAAAGALITKRVQGTVELVSYWGHVSTFTVRNTGQPPFAINTHEIVVRNAGNRAATNVRISHRALPDQFNVVPSVPYSIDPLPDGTKDILIPTLVPRQQITIAYFYYPPLTADQIHTGIRCDQGFAKPVVMEISEKTERWAMVLGVILAILGLVALVYIAVQAVALARRVLAAV